MTAFGVRLVAYEPAGARVGVLPSPLSAQASVVCNDAGALTATYSRLALRGEVLDRALSTGLEIAVEVTDHAGAWVEPAGARFVWVAREDDLADRAEVVKVAAPSWGWLLGRARLLDLEHLLPDEHSQAGKRPFYSASAGVILATLMQENAARGGVPVVAGFTTAADSAGAAWSQVATLYYEPGMDLRTIITNLADQGMCDWTTAGRTLRVYNTDTALATDRASSVRLHLGRDVAEAPSSQSLEEVVSRVLLRGDDGLTLTLDNPQAPTPWGAWEGYLSQGGVSDASTATRLVQSELERRARTRAQYTRALILPGAHSWPLVDYAPGDWITAPTDQPAERVRVQQVTLTLGADGVGGSLVLNDRVLDAEIRRSRRMSGIVGGSQSDGGSGARPAPQGPDRRTPAAPLGLVVDSDAFIDTDGAARGLLDVDWGDVSTASDGTALEVAGYDVAVRENVVGAPWSVVQSVEASQAVVAPLQVGAVLQVKVRARGRFTTTPGLWSAVATVTVADDVTPPAVPSTPVASVDRAVVRVTWNGKTAAGGTMPRDFDRVEIASDAAPTVPVGTVLAAGGGFILVTGLAYGEPVRYRARAVDRSGNASAWTGYSAAVTPTPLVSKDIDATITAAIDANREDLDQMGPVLDQAVTDLADAGQRLTTAESDLAQARTDLDASTGALDERLTTAESGLSDARDRLDAAEDLVADAITIADGANDTSADAIAVAHAAQTAADLANAAASAAVQGAGNVLGPNWGFELGDLTDWTVAAGAWSALASASAAEGSRVARTTTSGVQSALQATAPILTAPGQTWLMRARIRVVGALPTTGRMGMYLRQTGGASGEPRLVNIEAAALATGWQTFEGTYTIPSGAPIGIQARFWASADMTSGTVIEVDAVELRDWTQVKAALAAAATAQAAADTAHQAAGSAQDTADAAVTSAAGAGAAAQAAQAAAEDARARALNRALDPGFETPAAWSLSGRFSLTETERLTGARSLQVAAASAPARIEVLAPSPISVQPGQVWSIGAWCKTTPDYNGTSSNGKFRVSSQAGSNVAQAAWPNTGGQWQWVTVQYTVPDGGAVTALQAQVSGDHTAGMLWVDDLEVKNITEAAAALAAAQAVPVILHGTTAPAGTAPAGSTWMQHASDGGVIGQWEQTTAPSGGTWVARPIRSEVIANLDVGKLTAGTSVVVEQVAQKIAAATASFQTADVGNLFVSGTATVNEAVAQKIAASTADIQRANVANLFVTGTATLDEAVAQKIAASTAAFQRADIGNLFVTGTTTLDLAVAQEFWARKIAAQRVLANEVVIGGTSNALANAGFEDGLTGWVVSGGGAAAVTLSVDAHTGTQCLKYGAHASSRSVEQVAPIPVQPGETWRFTAWVRTTADYNGTSSNGKLRLADQDDTLLTGAVWPVSTNWTQVAMTYTVPATGVTALRPAFRGDHTTGTLWIDDVAAARMVDTALIIDGAVKARQIGAAEIEGYHVKTNTLTADNAVVGFLDGYVITGALIQTVSAANRGVKISGDGLIAYNGSGQVTVQIDGTTATITSGVVRSSATPSAQDGGWQLDTANGLRFWASRSDGSIGQGARLYANGRAVFYKPDGSIGVQITNGTLSIADGMLVGAMLADGSVTGPKIAANAVNSTQIAANAVGSTQIANGAVGTTQVAAGAVTRAKIGDNAVGTVQIANGAVTADLIAATAIDGKIITGATIQSGTSAVGTGSGIRLNGTGNNATINVWSGTNRVALNPGGGQPYIQWIRGSAAAYSAYAASSNRWTLWDNNANGQVITASRSQFWAQGATATSTASVNCRVGGSGDLYTVTSLRAMKLLIEDAPDQWADAALALRPRTWLDKPSHDAYADYLAGKRDEPGNPVPLSTRIPGFVAEEVAQVAPFLCTYDEDGRLTGVQYDRVPAALVILAQRQQHQIDALTAKVAALTPEAA